MIRKILLPICLCLVLLMSAFSTAVQQEPVKISSLEINIWPEYDRPETLIIYRILLSADTRLPAQISLRIPRTAGAPYSLAMKDLDGLLYDLEYTLISEGDWNRAVFITSSAEIQVEYYDPQMQKEDSLRTFRYRWIGDYPIDDLKIVVQQPRTATDLSIGPSFDRGVVNPDDQLKYYTADLGQLSTGIGYTMQFSYHKTTDSLSASTFSVSPAGDYPIQKTYYERVKSFVSTLQENRNLKVVIFLVLGCMLLLFLLSLLSEKQWIRLDTIKSGTRKSGVKEKTDTVEAVYCFQCGKLARRGDVFCRVCGSKLRMN